MEEGALCMPGSDHPNAISGSEPWKVNMTHQGALPFLPTAMSVCYLHVRPWAHLSLHSGNDFD
jgi:hypothetical protein